MDEEERRAKALEECLQQMHEGGMECGLNIMEIAKKINPEYLFAFPLYRGCMLIPKQHEHEVLSGCIMVYMYHDPHWLGHELNEETLPNFMNILTIGGQRSGQDYSLNGSEMDTRDFYKNLPFLNLVFYARKIADESGFSGDINIEDWEECLKEAFIRKYREDMGEE